MGVGATQINLHGDGFLYGAVARWDGQERPTRVVSRSLIQVELTAADVATPRTVQIVVFMAGTAGGVSNGVPFEVRAAAVTPPPPPASPPLQVTALSPEFVHAGSPAFRLTVTGTGFASGSVVRWNAQSLVTRFVSATTLEADVPAPLLTVPGTPRITVAGSGDVVSGEVPFRVREMYPILASVDPTTLIAGGATVAFRILGTNFGPPTQVQWDGVTLDSQMVNVKSSGEIVFELVGGYFAEPRNATVRVVNVYPSGRALGTPPKTVPIIPPPAPVISSVDPATVVAGTQTVLRILGQNFASSSEVKVDGQTLDRQVVSFQSASEIRVNLGGAYFVAGRPMSVAVVNKLPSGFTQTSASGTVQVVAAPNPNPADTQAPEITGPAPIIVATVEASGAIVTFPPPRATDNSGAVQVTCTPASGTRFPIGVTTVTCTARDPSGNTSSAQLTITVEAPPPDTTPPRITVPNDITVTATSAQGATATYPTPVVSDNLPGLSQPTCQPPSGSLFPVAVTIVTCTVRDAAGNTAAGSFRVIVNAPVGNPVTAATVSSLNPSWTVGGASTGTTSRDVEVNGSGFVPGAVVRWRGTRDLSTTFSSSTRLRAVLTATELSEAGAATITVRNPGGAESVAVPFIVIAPNPQITSLQPSSIAIGGPAFTLRINGQNFIPDMTTWFGTMTLPARFIDHTTLDVDVPAEAISVVKAIMLAASAGRVAVSGNYGAVRESAPATVALVPPAVVPAIGQLYPPYALAGGTLGAPGWLTVTGSDLYPGMRVRWNGRDTETRAATANILNGGTVTGSDVATPGVARISAFNPTNGRESQSLPFAVIAARDPRIGLMSPAPYPVGRAGTIEVRGENFIPGSQVLWNGSVRPTVFVNTTTLRAQIAGTDAAPGIGTEVLVGVAVPYFPGTGGTVTTTRALPISGGTNPVPVANQISPTTVRVGSQSVTLTVRGAGFVRGSVARWKGEARPTTYVSATELRATLSTTDLLVAGVGAVTVLNVGPGGGISAPRTVIIQ